MPTVRSQNLIVSEADIATDIVVTKGATGSHMFSFGEEREYLSNILALTGSPGSRLLQPCCELLFDSEMPKLLSDGYNVFVVVPTNIPTPGSIEPWRRIFIGSESVLPGSPTQGTGSGLSPLFRSQVEQIVIGVPSKLRERLSKFESNREDLEPVASSTKAAVNDLVTWLCSQSDSVSVTVSSDGMLSIAAGFENDVRLYIEVERNGSIEAAVTRERRFARDICGNTVPDLTSGVLLGAISSIRSI